MTFLHNKNELCRIIKLNKSIRFDKNGEYKTDNKKLIKILSTKFNVKLDDNYDDLNYKEIKEIVSKLENKPKKYNSLKKEVLIDFLRGRK